MDRDWVILLASKLMTSRFQAVWSRHVVDIGGIVFRKEFRNVYDSVERDDSPLSISPSPRIERYSSRKKLKVQKWVWHHATSCVIASIVGVYRLSLQVKRPPDSKTFSIIDSVSVEVSVSFSVTVHTVLYMLVWNRWKIVFGTSWFSIKLIWI